MVKAIGIRPLRMLAGALCFGAWALVPTPAASAQSGAGSLPGYYVAAWGSGAAGPLGTTACCADRTKPTGVPGAGPVSAIVAIDGGVVAVKPDGTVWTWGLSLPRPYVPALLPKRVPGLANVVALAAGSQFVLALTADGRVYSWGSGALGRPVSDLRSAGTPGPIPGLSHVTQIAAGGLNGLAITADGTLYSWGQNWTGEIGDGTRRERATPVRVPGLSQVISAATSGQNAVAVESDGSIWAWGDSAGGAPTRPGIIQSTVPVRVEGVPAATHVVAGFSTGLALARDGTVWAWGENSGDALHTGHPSPPSDGSPPARVVGLSDVTAVASGENRYMAIERDGSVWTWAGGLGGPARQPELKGAAAIAASPEQWLALVASPPPAPPRRVPTACSRIVNGHLVVGSYPSALLADARTGHVFVLDGQVQRTGGSPSRVCSASLSTIDGRTGRVLRTVLLGAGTESFRRSPMAVRDPRWLALEGRRVVAAYQPSLTSQDTAGGVSVVDAVTGKLLRSVPVGYSIYGLAADSATHRAFLSFAGDAGTENEDAAPSRLGIIDTRSGLVRSAGAPITGTPVVDPGAGRVFLLGDTKSVTVDTRSGKLVRSVMYAGGSLGGFGLARHAGRLFVAYGVQPHCCGPSLEILDSHTGKRVTELTGGSGYGPVLVDPPVGRVLVGRYGVSGPIRGYTEVRETRTGRLLRRLPVLIGPSSVDERNGRIYAITGPNTVTAIDPHGWRVVRQYHPGAALRATALNAVTNRVFVLSASGEGINGTQTIRSFCIAARCG